MKRALAVAAALVLLGCSNQPPPPPGRPSPDRSRTASPPPATGEALAALDRLCPDIEFPSVRGATGPVPAELRAVEDMVERARGLDYEEPVDMQAVTRRRMAELVEEQTAGPEIDRFLARRGRALEVMGAVPPGTDLAQAFRDFSTSQVIGFYEPDEDVLVFIGTDRLRAFDKFTLTHELVHALEDQRFDLGKLIDLDEECREEAGMAARGLAEGSATSYSLTAVREGFTEKELTELAEQALSMDPSIPDSVPEFLVKLEEWPYLEGMAFVDELRDVGGDDLVDYAFEHLPVTTEQIMHPDRFPKDTPIPLDVLDAAGPSGWETIDVGEVGEAWLKAYLEVLDAPDSAEAAEGWDGGIYRAWSDPDGRRTVVVLETAWDGPDEAEEFAQALEGSLDGPPVEVSVAGDRVTVRFGSDAAALGSLP